jgi:glucose-6-phosphate isomerase
MHQYRRLYSEVKCSYYKFEYSNLCAERILHTHFKLSLNDLEVVRSEVLSKITTCMPQLLQLLPYYNNDQITKLKEIVSDFKQSFKTIIVIGMGGAILNSKCLNDFLMPKDDFQVICMYKICPIYLAQVKESININETGFLFISNSGDTIETLLLAEFWYDNLKKLGYNDYSKRFIYVYGLKSQSLLAKLHERTQGVFLEYDSNMGGRFATFTTPNILLGLFLGLDIQDFFQGANTVLQDFLSGAESTVKSIIAGAAMTSNNLSSANFSMSIINSSYDSRFSGIIHWYSTALAETLCKNGTSLVISSLDLPIDQHGLMQSILENKMYQQFNLFSIQDKLESKLNDIILMLEDEICFQCDNHRIPLRKIILDNDNMLSLGAIMMHMILEVITAAVLTGVDPFTQPKIDNMKINLATHYRGHFVP